MFASPRYATRAFPAFTALLLLVSLRPAALELDGITKIRTEVTVERFGRDAREEALAIAERDALGILLESTLEPENVHKVGRLYDHLHAYIRTSRIVNYERLPEGTNIVAEVYFLTKPLRRDMASLLIAQFDEPPKALILMSEEIVNEGAPTAAEAGHAERALSEAFRNAGFEVVDTGALRESYTGSELLYMVRSDASGLAKFGRENRVDVVVAGGAAIVRKKISDIGNTIRTRASVHALIVRVGDDMEVETLRADAATSGIDKDAMARQAVTDACYKIQSDAVTASVLGIIHDQPLNDIWFGVQAIEAWHGKKEVLAALKRVAGVTDVEELRYSGGAYHFRVGYEGDLRAFVSALTEKSYSDFRLEPYRVVGSEVLLRAARS